MSRSIQQSDETIFSSGVSRVTVPDELNELVQYCIEEDQIILL
jgi:ubiquinone biosynthesis protein COQ9